MNVEFPAPLILQQKLFRINWSAPRSNQCKADCHCSNKPLQIFWLNLSVRNLQWNGKSFKRSHSTWVEKTQITQFNGQIVEARQASGILLRKQLECQNSWQSNSKFSEDRKVFFLLSSNVQLLRADCKQKPFALLMSLFMRTHSFASLFFCTKKSFLYANKTVWSIEREKYVLPCRSVGKGRFLALKARVSSFKRRKNLFFPVYGLFLCSII